MDQVVQSTSCQTSFYFEYSLILNPLVLNCLLSSWSVLYINGQQTGNEIFSILRNALPDWWGEVEITLLDSSHDLVITAAIEWWNTGQDDIAHNTGGPNIAFFAVFMSKDLWCNIIWSTNSLRELLTWFKLLSSTKIDDFDLVVFLICFQENILGLQITMHNVV